MSRRVPCSLLAALSSLAVLCLPAVAAAAPPVNTAVPGLSGEYRVGQQLTATNGTWTPSSGVAYVQSWERCNSDGDVCATISGRTGLKYTLESIDLGRTIRVAVRATGPDGTTAIARSAVTPVIAPREVPVLDPDLPPTVSGLAVEGQSLTATQGTWTGPGTITKTHKWQRCDVALTSCTTLTASAATYKLVPADIGSVMRVEVIATNPDGASAPAQSNVSAVVEGNPPAATARPTLAGDARDGQTLTIKTIGTWTGTAPLTTTYAWEECTAAGEEPCTPVPGKTTTSFPLDATHIGKTFRAVVTQSNVAGTTSSASLVTAAVGPKAPPVEVTPPAITGSAIDQQTLTASDGTWTGTAPITFTRQWQRCDNAGANCVDVTGTGTTYKLAPADVGSTLRVRVVAKNADDQTATVSAPSPVVLAAAPTITTAPAISGVARDGNELTATTGTWKGTAPLTYTYAWESCASPGDCTAVGGDANKLRLTTPEVGRTIKVTVTASNGGGSAASTSASTAAVVTGPPVNIAKPTITAPQPRDGQVFTADPGTWGGTGTPDFEYVWHRCSATGTGCAVIGGAGAQTYTASGTDVGKTIKVVVTALSPYGSGTGESVVSTPILAAKPAIDGAVTISGTLRDQQTVTATHAWTGTQPMTHTYAWQRCAVTCVDITGATQATYKLTASDVGARMRVRVTATNAGGTAVADSGDDVANPVVGADPPVRTGDPTLTGTAKEGATLTASAGTFTGTAPLDRTYEWLRCDVDGQNCSPIGGATAATYALAAADRGLTVRARVTATNSGGSDSATSLPSAVVGLTAPANTIAPAVTPNHGLRDGALVTTTTGTWSGSAPIEYTYQWQRCNAAGASCANIVGAADSTYRVTNAEVGFTMRVLVTATNGAGSDTKASLATGLVGTNPPTNDVAPALSIGGDGIAIDGAVVHTTTGTWSGVVPMTTTYEWRRCDDTGENCGTIPGATGSSYQLTPADVDLTIRAYVIQANAGGTNAALTAPTAKVIAAPPSNVVRPAIAGGPAIGKTLSASPGVWSGTPELRYDFQWLRCDLDGSNCLPIDGAQAATYVVRPADAALSLRVEVKASNDVGDDTEVSLSTGEVQTEPPAKITDPTIQTPDLLAQGSILQAQDGVWSGAQPITFTYQWRRCDVALTGCHDITDATGAAYQLVKEDVGKRIVLVVTAENVVDIATAQTAATEVVLPEPPANQTAPAIVSTGTLRDGAKLTVNNGTWKGATPMTFTVSWLRCDLTGAACVPATDVTGGTYTLTSEDVAHKMRARVTAKNAATEVAVDTAATAAIAAAPPSAALRPTVIALDGKAAVGGRLRGASGTWTGTSPMTTSLQWQRCVGTTTAACDDVPGATSNEYVLREADVGKRLRLVVTATNAGGTVVSESSPSEVVPAIPPGSPDNPSIVGGPIRQGVTLSSTPGTWNGTRPITLGYQWEACADVGAASCPKITGASNPTFAPSAKEVGKYLRLTITGVNAGGKTARSSVPVGPVEGLAPTVISPPTARASGTIKVGGTLSSTTGKWGGTAPLKYTTRWQRCDATGAACEDVEGGAKPTYKLTAEDINGTLLSRPMRVVVTATNVAGEVEAASALLGQVQGGVGVGAAGDTAVGAAARKKPRKARDTSGRGRPGQKTPTATGRTLARVKRLKFTPKGRLLLTLQCVKTSKTTCGAFGVLSSGKLRFYVDAGPIKKGKSKNVGFPLSKNDRKRLRGRKRIRFTVKLRAPQAKSKKAKAARKYVTVPKKIRGKVKAKKRKSTSRTKKASSKAQTKKVASKTQDASSKTKTKTTPAKDETTSTDPTTGAATAPSG
jgi:hypothetical protein